MDLQDIDLSDSKNFTNGVPHEWFAYLRREHPVQWHADPNGQAEGFWSVTSTSPPPWRPPSSSTWTRRPLPNCS